ncbi:MAG: hypothetical protein HFACDABA_02685 [Anaerolineales bacterium]|nr:hypothetical protein [Anaerolineales bacterium]
MHEIIVNLHMHTRYSDGSGLHRDIASAALRAGLDAVIVTDHNVLVKDFEGYHRDGSKRVLMLIGQEVHDQARTPQRNHLLIFGAQRDLSTLADEPQTLIHAVRDAGGICFLAHPYDPEAPLVHETNIDWVNWEVTGYTGIELWNHFSEFKLVVTSWGRAIFHAIFPKFYGRGPIPGTLQKWDELLASGKRVAAIGGSDAHAWPYRLGPIQRILFPYDFHFSALNTHLLVAEPLDGDSNLDGRRILEALGLGRGWIGYDLIAPTRGFRFSAQGREHHAVMGEELPLNSSVTLQGKFPGEAEVWLLRNGQPVQKWKRAERFSYTARESGVYRVEAYRRYLGARRGWIFSNPIYVK